MQYLDSHVGLLRKNLILLVEWVAFYPTRNYFVEQAAAAAHTKEDTNDTVQIIIYIHKQI